MSAIDIKATPCFKGERGFSAYEIAVKNGFIGTESDWLATLGTSSHFNEYKAMYVTTQLGETAFSLPEEFDANNCYFSVYVNGFRLSYDKYSLEDNNVVLNNGLDEIGAEVEIVVSKLITNNLPIVKSVNKTSTDDTVPSSKCLYEEVQNVLERYIDIETTIDLIDASAEISVLISYPLPFTFNNSRIMNFMTKNENAWEYDASEITISKVKLLEDGIQIYLKNNSGSSKSNVTFRIGILRVGD